MAGLDIAAGYRPSVPVNKGQKPPFPYGKKRSSVLDIRSALLPHDVSDLYDSVHGSGNSRMLDALDTMPKADTGNARSVVRGAMGGMVPNVSYGAESSRYSPADETVHIDNRTHQRFPVAVSVHEGAHAFQSGRSDVDEKVNDRRTFGLHDSVAHELGPSLLGTAAEAEARRRGGTPVPDVSYEFPSGYAPKLDWIRQQADRFGLFNGENNIDDLLAKNPQWLNTIAQQGTQTSQMQPPTGEGLDLLLGRDDPTVDVNPAGSSIANRQRQRDIGGQLPSIDGSGRVSPSPPQKAVGNAAPVVSQTTQPLRRSDNRPQINTPNTATTIPQNEDSNMASGLDIAAGYRPSVPANKKKYRDLPNLRDAQQEIYNAFYGHEGDGYIPGSLERAREKTANGGPIPGWSSSVPPVRVNTTGDPLLPATSGGPTASALSPFDAETLRRGNATGYYARPESSIRRIADDIFNREQAEIAHPSTDAGIIDFRNRQAARDRAAGLNIGNRTGGQGINPMMPGAAGMGTGPSNTNYGGQGSRTNFYINRENVANEDPRTAERQQGLTDLAMIDRFAKASGISRDEAIEMNQGQSIGAPTDAASRMNALRQIGGPKGAADAGLLDRFVSGSSLTRTPNDSPERTAMLDNIAAIRQREKERKENRLGSLDDPESIASQLKSRGLAKGEARQQRLLDRAAGPSFDDRLAMMAARRDPLGTLALSNQRYGDNAGILRSRLENQPQQQISPETQRMDAMTLAYYSPGPNGEPSPAERGVTRTEFGFPEPGGSSGVVTGGRTLPAGTPLPPQYAGLAGEQLRDALLRDGYSRDTVTEVLRRTDPGATISSPTKPGLFSPLQNIRRGRDPLGFMGLLGY